MSCKFSQFSFPSSDGIHKISAYIREPHGKIKGVIQICHGMIDHIERYSGLAEYFAEQGFVVAGNDHLGHGKSVFSPDEYGFFSEKNSQRLLISDIHIFNRILRTRYPKIPIILLGHSMGSFIARLYAVSYPHSLHGLIILGTSGPNALVGFGRVLAAVNSAVYGSRNRSKFIAKLAFSGYNSKFPKEEGHNAWLTRESSLVADRDTDERTNFTFTVSGYRTLFKMLSASNSREWYKKFPKHLPTLIVSGDMDPVGAYGKGPMTVYKKLLIAGVRGVSIKLYEGARHELFNETNREEFFEDTLHWILGITG